MWTQSLSQNKSIREGNTKAVLKQGERDGQRKTQKGAWVLEIYLIILLFMSKYSVECHVSADGALTFVIPIIPPCTMSWESLLILFSCWFQLLSHLGKPSSALSPWAPDCHQFWWGILSIRPKTGFYRWGISKSTFLVTCIPSKTLPKWFLKRTIDWSIRMKMQAACISSDI